jgi:hypothetical protein
MPANGLMLDRLGSVRMDRRQFPHGAGWTGATPLEACAGGPAAALPAASPASAPVPPASGAAGAASPAAALVGGG